jgi:hypothetical protein
MHGTRGIDAHFVNGTDIVAFGDDGFRGVFVHLELRTLGLLFGLRFLVADDGVLVARDHLAAFRLPAIRGTDLYQLWLRCDLLSEMRTDLRLIAIRIGAGVLLTKIGKEQLVVACAFRTIDTASGDSHQMRIPFIEGRILEKEQDVLFDPKTASFEREARCAWLCGRSIRSSLHGSKPRALVPADRLAASPAGEHGQRRFRRDRRLLLQQARGPST